MLKVLVTGSAGFIGSRVVEFLLDSGYSVTGLDNMNGYYDVQLKYFRLDKLLKQSSFHFVQADIQDGKSLENIFKSGGYDAVVHLAAMAGIRFSIENPEIYLSTNVEGTFNILENIRKYNISKFVFSSSSSVYSGCTLPFREDAVTDSPLSIYAATKNTGELFTRLYHSLYGIPTTILRYFTVYGPQGRPDMCYFRFIRCTIEGKIIEMFGDGTQKREFTFVDDVARATIDALHMDGCHTMNIGAGEESISMNNLVNLIAELVGKTTEIRYMQSLNADLVETRADIARAKKLLNWEPRVSFQDGICATVKWHLENEEFVRGLRY